MNKRLLVLGIATLLLSSFVFAYPYGYSATDGSKVFYNSKGKIIGVEDSRYQISRLPTLYEILINKYNPFNIR